MADSPESAPISGGKSSEIAAFFSSVWGKIIAVLTTITMLGGLAAEGLSLYRNWQDSVIASK
jgi:hypothetical protein